jgi:hypothetical protein
MRDCESLHEIDSQLLEHFTQNSLLLVHRLLISPYQSSLLILLKSLKDLILGYWQLDEDLFLCQVTRRRAVRV